jgi:DNA-binding transcriptional MerR regulator/methylmalonyl-CoA mutase cobalamin-binding subunit
MIETMDDAEMEIAKEPGLGIRAVAKRLGISQHLIRVWEKRYRAVTPNRTDSNRRLYSESEIEHLRLLHLAVLAGHRIGDIASLASAELERLVGTKTATVPAVVSENTSAYFVERALKAIKKLDGEELDAVLTLAEVQLGQAVVLHNVILPLMDQVGSLWQDGSLRIAHEHMATAMVSQHVGAMLLSHRYQANAPSIVISTPAGQLHELGAMIAAVQAALEGWRPVYLGPSLPAEEIAGSVQQTGATAIALSVVFPADDPRLPGEMARLRRLVGDQIPIIIGGAAAPAYQSALLGAGIILVEDMVGLRKQLAELRSA